MKLYFRLKKILRNLFYSTISLFFIFSFLFSDQKIRLKEIKIGEPEEIFFSKPIDIESANSKVFVLDSQECTVSVFAVEGKLLTKIGRYGRGPGEFIGSSDMDILSDEVALIDSEGQRVQFYGHDGTYRGEFKIGFRGHRLLSLSKDKFIISYMPQPKEKNVFLLHGFNRQGKKIFVAEKISSSGEGASDFFLFQHYLRKVAGRPVLFKNFSPEVAFFLDENGQRTRILKADPALPIIQFQPPLSRARKIQNIFWSVSTFNDKIYFVLPGKMEDGDIGPSPRVAVLTAEGKFETIIEFPFPIYRLARLNNRFFVIDESARLRLFDLENF